MIVYFVGIGGVSMSALAKYLFYKGFLVEGSDKNFGETVESLKKLGIKIYNQNTESGINYADIVVVNSAISTDNVELILAKKLKKPIYERAELLNEIIKNYKKSIGVSGSHGKTTVTAMIAHIFNLSNVNCVAHVGGIDNEFSNLLYTENADCFISEICEYKKNILKTKVSQSVILNIDDDHLDCYGNVDNLIKAFKSFSNNSAVTFYNYDDANLVNFKGVSFGYSKGANYRAVKLKSNNGVYTFSVEYLGKIITTITLKISGAYNVLNALSAFAVGHYNGVEVKTIKTALENFTGVGRRNEFLFKIGNCSVYADYCHHPTEIQSFINSVKERCKSPLFIFEPHTYSRTKLLFNDFKSVLKNENVLLYKTYPAREKYDKKGSALALSTVINKPYFSSFSCLYNYMLQNANRYDGIFVLGAGSLYEKLKKHR